MDSLFLVISIVSLFAIFIFGIISLVSFIKKNGTKGKKMLVFSGISVLVMIISFFAFGLTTDTTTTAETESAKEVEPVKEETAEEKATREAKEAEEKAAAEEKAKQEAEAKAKAEAEQLAKEEAEEKARQEQLAKEAAEKKANAQTIEYAQLKKNPDRYSDEYVKYTGEIVQILEGDGMTNIRLSVTKESYGYSFNDIVFVEYVGYTDFVDNDIVTIYGTVYGEYTYESQAGYNISLPGIIADEVLPAE